MSQDVAVAMRLSKDQQRPDSKELIAKFNAAFGKPVRLCHQCPPHPCSSLFVS
jgi:hypothetical protein